MDQRWQSPPLILTLSCSRRDWSNRWVNCCAQGHPAGPCFQPEFTLDIPRQRGDPPVRMILILASLTGWLDREALPPRRCRKHSLQDVTVSSRCFFPRRRVLPAADATPGILSAPCSGLWVVPRLLQPCLHLPAFWDGLHGAVFKGPSSASIAPSRSRWALRFSLWGWTPTLPFLPCSVPQVSWLYLAARTLRVVAAKTANFFKNLKQLECVCLVWSYSCYRQLPPSWQRPFALRTASLPPASPTLAVHTKLFFIFYFF